MPAYKDPKLKTWYAKFSYKDSSGKTRFTTKRGFHSKREAIEYEEHFKNGLLNMSFSKFVDIYREDRYVRIRKSTAASKDHMIDTKLNPFFGKMRIAEIKPRDILKWQNKMLSYRNPKTGQPYEDTYLRALNNQINAIFNHAVKFYGLDDNPVRRVESIGKKHAKEMRFWTPEEYKRFANSMIEHPFFFYCFEILFWTGIREGELLALTFDDFNFENQTLSITKTYQIVKGEEIIGPTKSAKGNRVVYMPDKLSKELEEYFKQTRHKNTSRAFPTNKSVLTRAMKSGIARSGVKEIRVHDLRHSHVSHLIELGFSAVEIGNRLGHESITITMRYAHMRTDAQKRITDRLNMVISNEMT